MTRWWMLLLLAATAAVAQTQDSRSYTPVVPNASSVSSYGGYYGGGHASTVEEGAMNGMANVISAQGSANLSNSAAAVNFTQARANAIQNQQLYTNTYFEMQETNKQARAAKSGPKPTMEQLVRLSREGAPQQLGSQQLDPVTGKLLWTNILMDDYFGPQRAAVDQLFAKRASQGGLSFSDQSQLRQVIEQMFGEMKAKIKDIPPQEYVDSRNFLKGVMYAGAKAELE